MSRLRVLLVEDEFLVRLVAAEFLQDEGFEVVEAGDGDEAVRLLLGANRFDVLFTDVRMPGELDGVDVVAHARRRDPTLPVLVVSGHSSRVIARLDGLQPPVHFLSKPYSLPVVLDKLQRLIRAR